MSKTTNSIWIAAAIAIITPFIMQHEGLKLKASPDVGTTQSVCYGHDGVARGQMYTKAECQTLLVSDVNKVTSSILEITPDLVTHTNQLAAAIDFSYNVGVGAYSKGSVTRDFNEGNYKAGCAAMLLYDNVNGKYNQGLASRRRAEYNICIKGL